MALVMALAAQAFHGVDARAVVQRFQEGGTTLFCGFVPYGFLLLLDAEGTRRLLRGLGHDVGLRRLFFVRSATEALHTSLPGGALVADSSQPEILQASGVPRTHGVAVALARKWMIMGAHGVFLASASVMGFGALQRASVALVGHGALPWGVVLSALVPLLGAVVLAMSFGMHQGMRRIQWGLAQVPIAAVRRWGAQESSRFSEADQATATLLRRGIFGPRGAFLFFLGSWFLESAETWWLLRLVGTPVSVPTVLALQSALSLVRSAVFVVPAGVGVEDAGYALLLKALGVADDVSTVLAFVMLKRVKELCWVGVGYAALLLQGLRRHRDPVLAPVVPAQA